MLRMLEFSCRDVTEAADDYLERRLGPWRRFKLRLHLRICQHCRRYLRQIEHTIALLKALPKERPAPETSQALIEAFRQRHATGSASASPPSSDRV
jgi:predicted anti-sigma-YlaC factor YlaD